MSQIRFNYAAIGDTTAAIKQFQSLMHSELKGLETDFNNLFGDFTGAAAQAFNDARVKWNAGADKIREALFQVGVKLDEAAARMQELDHRTASKIGE